MATKVRKHTDTKKVIRFKRKKRIRSRVAGSTEMPRLTIFKSNSNFYAQLIDDTKGVTLLSVSTLEKDNRDKVKNTLEGALTLGRMVAEKAKAQRIEHVVFDRAGYIYHGKVKAFADAAREAGLKF